MAEYSSESSTSPSPKKKHGSGSKHQSAGLIKQKNYHQSTSHSPVSKKDKRSHGRKHEKKKGSRSRSPEKSKRSQKENAIYNQDQDHQKGENGREVIRNLSVNHDLVHLTIMLKNTVNSRKVDHDL